MTKHKNINLNFYLSFYDSVYKEIKENSIILSATWINESQCIEYTIQGQLYEKD